MFVGGWWICCFWYGENEEDSDWNIRMKLLIDCFEVIVGIEVFYFM